MIGRAVLPYLGGTPQVWNTCMVFFQAALLAGYLYSHEITRRFGLKKQLLFHFVLLLLPLAPLAWLKLDVGHVARDWFLPPTEANPIPWLLGVLALVAGLPFFVVATSAPLLQKWYADTGAMGAKDPYFLYGASNLGSMLALVAYPTLIEPKLGLPEQAKYWAIGYAALLTLTLLCGVLARAFAGRKEKGPGLEWLHAAQRDTYADDREDGVPLLRGIRWIALAFVPSSLMLGVTTYVTTDIAAVALLWIIPLTLYLLTFILVFTRLPRGFDYVMLALLLGIAAVLLAPVRVHSSGDVLLRDVPLTDLLPLQLGPDLSQFLALRHLLYFLGFVLVCLLLPRLTRAVMIVLLPVVIVLLILLQPHGVMIRLSWFHVGRWWLDDYLVLNKTWEQIGLHFVALFVTAMVCHGELARTRPETRHLTGFYLCMSIGGVLGGLFNTVLAPLAFQSVLEYPLMIALACLLLPRLGLNRQNAWGRMMDLVMPSCLCAFGLVALFFFLMRDPGIREYVAERVERMALARSSSDAAWIRGLGTPERDLLHRERGFFGVVRVRQNANWKGRYHYLQHGNIWHGLQRIQPTPQLEAAVCAPLAACTQPLDAALSLVIREQARKDRSREEPIAYFQKCGPIGDLFAEARARNRKLRIGVLGMGTGTLAGYAEPGWEIDYYEIDPAVKRIAFDTRYFTYLSDAIQRGVKVETYLGDGRLQIQKQAPDRSYDLIFMDAFSSDSVPVHLLTREAVQMYLDKLADGGIIIVNVANLYLDLAPVFGNLAADLHLASMLGSSHSDDWWAMDDADLYACDWVLLARKREDFGQLNDLVGTYNGMRSWIELPRRPELGVWTDNYSNLLSVFNWQQHKPKPSDAYQEWYPDE
jgi:predicted O-methyltransferase YrrM